MRKRKGCGCFSLVVVLLIIALLAGIGIKNKDKILALFYPRDYENIISAYCDEYGVDKWLVFALIKAESGFDQDAVSSAGAHGLMQLMPETAQWLIDKGEFTLDVDTALNDPEENIHLGVYYLSVLFTNYQNSQGYTDPAIVIAAYNAGMGSVSEWLNDKTWDGSLTNVADIPYRETERHVKSVLRNYNTYTRLYGDSTE